MFDTIKLTKLFELCSVFLSDQTPGAIVLNLSYEDIQKKLNKALKRNLQNQVQTLPQTNKQIQNEEVNETSAVSEEVPEAGLVEENSE